MSVFVHVGIVHGAKRIGIFTLMLCNISLVDPSERFHEPDTISTLSLRLIIVKNSHVV
jgi:hypothetical protein